MQKQYTGALKSPKDLRDYKIAKSSMKIELPKEFVLNHAHIKNQGEVNSCVAHSLSSILELKDGINYSTGWIYGYRPDEYYQGQGMYISEALKTLLKVGYLSNEELNSNVEMNEAKEIVNKNIENYKIKADKRKITSYARLNTVDEIKQAMYLYKTPVIMCIDIDEQGLELDGNYVAYIPTKSNSSHAIVCYGWNETGLLIQNSWGEEWGNNGTFILPYNYSFYEAWIISFTKQNDNNIEKPKNDNKDNNQEEVEIDDNTIPNIVKPNNYWIREIIMIIVQFIKSLIKK